jgi:hypothetical protein
MATTTDYSTGQTLGVNLQQVFTPSTDLYPYAPDKPDFLQGQIAVGTDNTQWVYVLASANIAQGDVVTLTTGYAAAPITSTNGAFGNQVAVAQVAIASGSYGWVQRAGPATYINVAGACAPNVQLATTGTDGALDDAVTTGTKDITGIIITATNPLTSSVSAVAGTLNFPIVGTTN